MPFRFFRKKLSPDPTALPIYTTPSRTIVGGRSFLTDAAYVFPKDIPESDRLNFQHYLLRGVLKGNYAAPLSKNEKSILDVGCGTGIWVREMAREFPHTQVIGVDIELPKLSSTATPDPTNNLFVQGNVMQGLPFSENHFDFVHQRLLVAAIPAKQWPGVVAELVRVTRPGGLVELVDAADAFKNSGPMTETMMDWWRQAAAKTGFDASMMAHLDNLLAGAGLHEVKQHVVPVPLSWGGRVGDMMAKDLQAIFGNLLPLVCNRLHITSEQKFQKTLDALPSEWVRYQTTFHFFVAYGKKL